jgi:hypothetical protein
MHRTARPSTVKDIRDFVEKVTKLVVEAGGRNDIDTFVYTHVIPVTRFGPLHVSVHDSHDGSLGWVACKFMYPQLADGNVGGQSLNPYSGKWNFHFGRETTVDEAVAEFRRAFDPMLYDDIARVRVGSDR